MATKTMPKPKGVADETDEQRFVRLATARVNRALKDLSLIGNLGSGQYGKTDAQVSKIENALSSGLASAMDRLRHVKSNAPRFSL